MTSQTNDSPDITASIMETSLGRNPKTVNRGCWSMKFREIINRVSIPGGFVRHDSTPWDLDVEETIGEEIASREFTQQEAEEISLFLRGMIIDALSNPEFARKIIDYCDLVRERKNKDS